MRSRRSGSWALGDVIIGLHIYTRARFDGGPLRHTSVPMLGMGLVGAAPISCSAYVFWGSDYTCIQKCMYSQIVCNGFWRFTFCLLLECNLFAFYCLYCLFAASLHCICSAYAPMWVTTFSRA